MLEMMENWFLHFCCICPIQRSFWGHSVTLSDTMPLWGLRDNGKNNVRRGFESPETFESSCAPISLTKRRRNMRIRQHSFNKNWRKNGQKFVHSWWKTLPTSNRVQTDQLPSNRYRVDNNRRKGTDLWVPWASVIWWAPTVFFVNFPVPMMLSGVSY